MKPMPKEDTLSTLMFLLTGQLAEGGRPSIFIHGRLLRYICFARKALRVCIGVNTRLQGRNRLDGPVVRRRPRQEEIKGLNLVFPCEIVPVTLTLVL